MALTSKAIVKRFWQKIDPKVLFKPVELLEEKIVMLIRKSIKIKLMVMDNCIIITAQYLILVEMC